MKISRCCWAVGFSWIITAGIATARAPNIVFVVADQWRAQAFG